jgi:hypothetical protein
MPRQEPGTARRPSGPCGGSAAPHGLSVGIAGVPRKHCADDTLHVRVDVSHTAPLTSVKVHLNGRTIRLGTSARFTVRIPPHKLHKGRNRVAVIARDAEGGFEVAVKRFRRC